jgi:hypothetical protein
VGLSPAQIKEWLDRRVFDQDTEDKFRGVDGRRVSREDMFNLPEGIKPVRPPQEVFDKHFEEFEERKRNGFPRDPIALSRSCTAKPSTYNLDPI